MSLKVIKCIDYEDELDLLVVTTVSQLDESSSSGQGHVFLVDSQTGKLRKRIELVEPILEVKCWQFTVDTIIGTDNIDTKDCGPL